MRNGFAGWCEAVALPGRTLAIENWGYARRCRCPNTSVSRSRRGGPAASSQSHQL